MAQVTVREISKRFGSTPVLHDVSLEVPDGAFLSLLGPSGCGKSTLLRIIAGLEIQDAGSVAIAGRDVGDLRPSRRNLAMVFQSYALYPHLTVADNMLTPLRMRDLSFAERLPLVGRLVPGQAAKRAAMQRRVAQVAETLRIEPLLGRKPAQLSGGQRQRVALGRAMVREPAAFLMDEPLSNLDAALRVHMRAEIAELHRALGATVVYVTHDQVEAMTMSDRIAVMLDGRLLQVGSPAEIYDDPADQRVAAFIGSPPINLLDGTVGADGSVLLGDGPLPVRLAAAAGAPLRIGLRPERLRIADPARAPLAGRLRHRENLGSDMLLHVATAPGSAAVIARVEPASARGLTLGQPVGLSFDEADLLLFGADGRRVRPLAAPEPERALRHG